jgi:hypothetical protein
LLNLIRALEKVSTFDLISAADSIADILQIFPDRRTRTGRCAGVRQTGQWLKSVARGHFNYYAVPGNIDTLAYWRFREPSVSHDRAYHDLKRVLLIAAAILAARKLSGFDGGERILHP